MNSPSNLQLSRSRIIKDQNIAKPGESVVITAGVPFGNAGATNLLRIAKIIDDKDLI